MSRISKLFLVQICILLTVTAANAAGMSGAELLQRSYTAEKHATFCGKQRTTVITGNKMAIGSVEVRALAGRMHMKYLTGPSGGTTIIDNGTSLMRIVPSTRTVRVSEHSPSSRQLVRLLSNYDPVVQGSARIAGRDCQILTLHPRHPESPWKRLWIDKRTGIALRTEQYAPGGRLAMRTEYTSIDFKAHPGLAEFLAPRGWKMVRVSSRCSASGEAAVRRTMGFSLIKPEYVPRGYSYQGIEICHPCKSMTMAALRYSNGLNTISVFESASDCGLKCGNQNCTHGGGCSGCMMPGSSRARMAHAVVRGVTVVIVGNTTSNELRKMAQSMH